MLNKTCGWLGQTLSRCLWAACVTAVVFAGAVQAQEIEARLYSNAPINYNFLGVGFTQVTTNKFQLNTEVLAYNRTFDFFGQSGKVNLIVPYAQLHGHTTTGSQVISGSSVGLTDPIIRLATNLYGAPALTVEEFKNYQQDLIIGASLLVSAPLGQYDDSRIVNISNHRWSFKPEVGVSQALGPWTLELQAAATFFTDTTDFYGGNTRSQDPIYSLQGHAIYGFRSGVWSSFDVTYFNGGRTTINGALGDDLQQNWRVGATLAVPVDIHNSIKFYASSGVAARTGNNFDMVGIAWQYRWGAGL